MEYGYADKRGGMISRIGRLLPARVTGENPDETGPPLRFRRWSSRWGGKKLLILVGILCAALAVGGTIAYLVQALNTETNQFVFGDAGVTIIENFNGWDQKRVQLENTGNVPGLVRAMVVPVLKDENGTEGRGGALLPLEEPNGNLIDMGDFIFELNEFWTNNWFYRDGYFYCNRVLGPGDSTAPLLERVYLADDGDEIVKARYAGITMQVEVLADIIQADGDAPEAWGLIVNGDVVTPIP